MGAVILPNSDYTIYGDIFTNNSNYFHNMQGENSMWAMPTSSNMAQIADQDHHELQRGRDILQANMDVFDEYAEGGNSTVLEEDKKDEFSYISKENSYIINIDDSTSSNNLITDGVINTLFSPLLELHDSDQLCAAKNDLIASSTLLNSENLLNILPDPFNFYTPDQSSTSSSDQESNPCFSSSYEASVLMPSLDFLSPVHGPSDHSATRCSSFNSRSAEVCSSNSVQEFDDHKLSSMQAAACGHSELKPCNPLQTACDHPQVKPCNSMQSACDHPQYLDRCDNMQAACDHPRQLKPCSSMEEFDDHKVLLRHRNSPLESANIPCSCAPHHQLDHYSTLYSINGAAAAADMGKCSEVLSSCKIVAGGAQEESLNNIPAKNSSDHHMVSDHAGYESVCDHGSYTSISDHLKNDGTSDYKVICDQGHDGMYDPGHEHMVCDHGSFPTHMKMMQREAVYAAAALQPVDWSSILAISAGTRPKRRNVRISHDPQTVSARRRRERISDRIRVLQRLVPGGTSMDTASMLDEAIHYLKFLKSQVQALEWLERGSSTLPLSTSSSSSSCFYPNFTSTSLPKQRMIK